MSGLPPEGDEPSHYECFETLSINTMAYSQPGYSRKLDGWRQAGSLSFRMLSLAIVSEVRFATMERMEILPSKRWWFVPLATVFFLLIAEMVLFLCLKNPVALDDGLRHFAMGRLIVLQGIDAGQWSHFLFAGYFSTHRTDPWFLGDLLFVPLVRFGPVLALRIFALGSSALLLGVFLWACRLFRIPSVATALLLILLVAFEENFFYRLLLGRPFVLLTVLSVLLTIAILRRQPIIVAVALSAAVLLSHLFVFPLLIVAAGVLWRVSLREYKQASVLFFVAFVGMCVGVALHPAAGDYLQYFMTTFLRGPFLIGLDISKEMRSGLLFDLRSLFALAVIALLHVVLFQNGYSCARYHRSGLTFLAGIVLFFAVLFLLWMRSIDFLWPFTILFLIVLLHEEPTLIQETTKRLFPASRRLRIGVFSTLTVALCGSVYIHEARALITTDDRRSLQMYADALRDVSPGARILNVDWHFFPPAVAVRPDLRFATGIDPSFTFLVDPQASSLLLELLTPTFQSAPQPQDVRRWLRELRNTFPPADVLVLYRDRHAALVDVLSRNLRFNDISSAPAIAVFPFAIP